MDPTRYVMFTVTVCFVGSGKSRTRSPFCRRYSVIPSTDVTRSTPFGRAGDAAWAKIIAGSIQMNTIRAVNRGFIYKESSGKHIIISILATHVFCCGSVVHFFARPCAFAHYYLQQQRLCSPLDWGIASPASAMNATF